MPKLRFPFEGEVYVSSPYGSRILNGQSVWHSGVDLVARQNKMVIAPCDGIIGSSTIITDKSNRTWEFGNYVRLDTSDGYSIFMCHMDSRFVKTGDVVKRGEPIGIMGNTGYSFGAHTHFEVRRNGCTVNPMSMFEEANMIYAGLTYGSLNKIEKNDKKEEDDMTKDEVIAIIKEYEQAKKSEQVPEWATDELSEAIGVGITDGTRPMEDTPRYQTAIMCKRVYTKLKAMIEKLSADIGDLNAHK